MPVRGGRGRAGARRRRARAAAAAERRDRHAREPLVGVVQGHRRLPPRLRRRRGADPRAPVPAQDACSPRTSAAWSGSRAASPATSRAASSPIGGPRGPCARVRRAAPAKPVQVVYGPGTFLNEAVRQIQEEFTSQQQRARPAASRRAARAARALAAGAGPVQGRAGPARRARRASSSRRSTCATRSRSRRPTTCARCRSSTTPSSSPARVRPEPRRRRARRRASRYLFPSRNSALIQVRLQPGAERRAAAAGDLADRAGHARDVPDGRPCAPCFTLNGGGTYVVTRRAGGAGGADHEHHELDRAPARRRAAGDGRDARAGVPQPPAAAAAGDRAGRGRAHVRGDGARRRPRSRWPRSPCCRC